MEKFRPYILGRRGEPLIQRKRATTNELVKKIEVVVPTPLTQLSATNYIHWAMRMKVQLDAQGLWETVAETKMNRQKDRIALSAMLAAISESSRVQLDIKKLAKVNWEIIRSFHVGIDRPAQSRAQGLRREFENLSMKKTNKVSELPDEFKKELCSNYDSSERGLMTKKLSRNSLGQCRRGMTL